MNDACTRLTLDVQENRAPVVVKAKKSDTGRKLRITLADGGMPYEISSDCYAVFTANKPDNTKIYNDCQIVNNAVEYAFTEQTCAEAGRLTAEIKLYGGDHKMLTSARFILEVHPTVFSEGDEIASETETNALDALILETTALKTEIEQKLENGDFVGPAGEKGDTGEKGNTGAPGVGIVGIRIQEV